MPWRIVLIEDSPEDRAELRRLLLLGSDRRYVFVEAETAAQGVAAVRDPTAGPTTCVLLDYYLPDAQGEDVLAQLVGDDGVLRAPVVVLTIDTSRELGPRALRAGAEDFVGKSWMTPESLTRTVENAVERWALARELRESEARFRQLAAAVPQAVWMLDAAGHLLYANDRWHAYFGAQVAACAQGDWSSVHHPDERDDFARLADGEVAFDRDLRLLGADGQYRWSQVNAVPIRDAAGALTHWYGVNTDIHERKLAEHRLGVEHAVSRILAQARGFADAVPAMLRAIARGLELDVCALWLLDDDGEALRCFEAFDGGDPRFAPFTAASRALRCPPGVGLPGQVWATRAPAWMPSISRSPRARVAELAGLTTGAAYPIAAGDQILGVIELFTVRARPNDPGLLAMLTALGHELGQFLLRKRAEQAAADGSARLRLALEASRIGLWTWHLGSDAVEWTPECYAIHGIAPGAFAGTGAAFFALVHPDDRARVEATVRRAIALHDVYTCELRIVRPDGAVRWVQNRGRADYDADGTPRQMLGSLTDVDERKRITEALARSGERLDRAQRAAHLGTWDWNVVTGDASWTDEAWRVFQGTAPQDVPVTFERFLACVHPDDRARAADAARDALRSGHYQDVFRVCHASGEVRWIESEADVVLADDHAPLRMVGTARDVTERRESDLALRAALERAELAVQTRDQLVSLVSHDLRNPLGALAMEVSLLTMRDAGGGPSDGLSRSLARMERQLSTMTRMVDELLDVTVLQAGAPLALELRETDLVELTRRLAAEHQRAARRHRIEVHAAPEAVVGLWDAGRIERAVDNLISNAIKYSPRGGSVVVDVATPGGELAVLRVRDDGIGILPTDQARVFEWFSRGENAKQSAIRGIGIGLAGAKQIVEQHGGSISLESEAGKGSTFTVRLPLQPPARAAGDALRSPASPGCAHSAAG